MSDLAKRSAAMLADPQFWRMFFPLFCDEAKVREFSQVSKIPEAHIRAARRKYLAGYLLKLDTHFHESNAVH